MDKYRHLLVWLILNLVNQHHNWNEKCTQM